MRTIDVLRYFDPFSVLAGFHPTIQLVYFSRKLLKILQNLPAHCFAVWTDIAEYVYLITTSNYWPQFQDWSSRLWAKARPGDLIFSATSASYSWQMDPANVLIPELVAAIFVFHSFPDGRNGERFPEQARRTWGEKRGGRDSRGRVIEGLNRRIKWGDFGSQQSKLHAYFLVYQVLWREEGMGLLYPHHLFVHIFSISSQLLMRNFVDRLYKSSKSVN